MASCYIAQRAHSGLCDDLKGWTELGGAQEGGDKCVHPAVSRCCIVETNQHRKAIIVRFFLRKTRLDANGNNPAN